MKKFVAILLSLALVSSLAGCKLTSTTLTTTESNATLETSNSSAASTSIVSSTPNTEAIKVGLIISTNGLGDQSINDQAYDGLKRAESELGVEIKLMEPKDASQIIDMEQKLAESGCKIIINDSFDMADAVSQTADKYPNVKFVILDTIVEKPNVISVTYQTHEGSFLAGVVAAMNSKTGTIGFVGGMEIPTIKRFAVGYTEGAKYINPDINVLIKYIGNDATAWSDAAKGKAIAEDLASNNADVVFHAAGGSGLGVIEGCKSKGIWAIGVNIDQENVAPGTVLTSMLTKGDVAVYESIRALVNNEEIGNKLVMSLENDGVGVVLSQYLTEDMKTKIEEIKGKIIAGEIVVTDAMAE